ncbi:arylsulfatase [Anatilimnocola sp. NA78]|uniref:sulfatase family protein n=1 Tax=Anatilimnocola sp. NA78 TaxID=3415683 RepID=UPI003CE577BD
MRLLHRLATLIIAAAATDAAFSAEKADESTKTGRVPNIVLILADDLGYGDLGCYNRDSKIPTPHLDGLAASGMRFTDSHSPSSVCSPTRYALLTGRYAWRTRLQRGVLGPWSRPLIAPEQLTIATLLRQHGYATGCIGKWHLGWEWPTKDGKPPSNGADNLSNVDFTKPIANGPTTRGFDFYYGTDVPNYAPFCFIENNRTVGNPTVPFGPQKGPSLPGWDWVNVLPELTKQAIRFVEERAKANQPFFLYFPLTSPHYPVVPAPEFKGKSGAGDFGDFVFQSDWTVGQLLGALQRAGVADNTLVVFTSDNGPEISNEVHPGAYDRIQKYGHASMGTLRGAKRDVWEGGHRIPFLARWPGKIKPGSSCAETICHVDLMATLAALLDVQLPDAAGVDSYNLLPTFLGQRLTKPIREATVHHSFSGKFAIRKGDWVLIVATTGDDNGKLGEPDWLKNARGYAPHNQMTELFDLREDLSERDNVAAEHPEVVTEMMELLRKYIAEGRSTPGEKQSNDVPVSFDKSKR